ncbi:MAG: CotH kinase family protein, partial [Planctomycetota bacterium]
VVSLGEYALTSDPRALAKFPFAEGAEVPAFGVFAKNLDLPESEFIKTRRWFLSRSGGSSKTRVVDVFRVPDAGESESAEKKKPGKDDAKPKTPKPPRPLEHRSWGLLPDGGLDPLALKRSSIGSTSGGADGRELVIHEIMYHPMSENPDEEYIEIYNRSSNSVRLTDYRIVGGIRYLFDSKARIGPQSYIVVAKNPSFLAGRYGLSRASVVGPFEGTLSDRGEEIRIEDARGRIVSLVPYGDRHPWPSWADGLGSSLELRHPDLDPTLAASWEASDESKKSKWKRYKYRKKHRKLHGQNFSGFQVLLLGAGETLIDNMAVGSKVNLTPDGDFEKQSPHWNGYGTHEGSRWSDEAHRGKKSYRVVSGGRGDTRQNFVSRSANFTPDSTYQVSFYARWLRGSPLLLTRSGGHGVAKTHRLEVPKKLGTPGKKNSAFEKEAKPSVGTPSQFPVAPTTEDSVRFSVNVSSISPVKLVTLRYRSDEIKEWQTVLLERSADRSGPLLASEEWRGVVPPMNGRIVEFSLRAQTGEVGHALFPNRRATETTGRPGPVAHYGLGIVPHRRFPTLTVLIGDEDWAKLHGNPRMSNQLRNASLVFGNERILYNIGVRRRGSPFTRNRYNWRLALGSDTIDGRPLLTMDGQGGDGTRLQERLAYWLLNTLQAPNSRQQYAYFRILGREEGVYEEVEKIDGRYADRWFGKSYERRRLIDSRSKRSKPKPKRRGGFVVDQNDFYKIDDHFEFQNGSRRNYDAFFDYKTPDIEDYRFNFKPRGEGCHENFAALIDLFKVLDPQVTPDKTFVSRVEDLVDVDTTLRVLAARNLIDDWDTIGRQRGKNAFLFRSERDGLWRLLPWDCDLAWRNPDSDLMSEKFPAIRRIYSIPTYRRQFLSYMAFLADYAFEAERFGAVCADLQDASGARTDSFREFAAKRRTKVLSEVPKVPFRVSSAKRVRDRSGHDVLRATGTAPILAYRLELDGRFAFPRFLDMRRWVADFPVGPEGGKKAVNALDLAGRLVGTYKVSVRSRSSAKDLPEIEEAPPVVIAPPRPVKPTVDEPTITHANPTTARARAGLPPERREGDPVDADSDDADPDDADPDDVASELGDPGSEIVLVELDEPLDDERSEEVASDLSLTETLEGAVEETRERVSRRDLLGTKIERLESEPDV